MAPGLSYCRWAAAFALLLVVGAPLILPIAELVQQGAGEWSANDRARLSHLSYNTLLLASGTVAVTLPVGVALAIFLFRTAFPGRRLLLGFVVLMLFVPLPMIASAWQAFFGNDGWLPLTWFGTSARRPWTTGLGPAVWVHALAGLPWVVLFVGMGLTWVERELEEEMLLRRPPWWVVWHVTLPRVRGMIVFAAIWLALQVSGEITVAYVMEVGTFAEDVHIQFSQGENALARAVVAAAPLILLTWAFLAWYLPRLDRLPPLQWKLTDPVRFDFRATRWPMAALIAGLVSLLFGVPVASLAWKLGQAGHPSQWFAANAWSHLGNAWRSHGVDLLRNVVVVLGTGGVVAMLALVLCWLADESPWFRRLLILLMSLSWALPGSIVGIGLKQTIDRLPDGPLRELFYYRASPLPLAWAYLIRFLPFAVAMMWTVVRLVPREPREAARLEGQGPWREFWTVVWPLTRRGTLWCGVLVSALCLAEVAASTRVETPGWESYVKLIFDRMHYGVENNVAAMCVLLLVLIVAIAVGIALSRRLLHGKS